MGSMTVGVDISAPAERVFRMMCDLEKAPERIDDIKKLEVLTEGPFGVGTRWRETRVMFGKEATEEMEVVGVDPGVGYTVRAESHGTKYVTTMACQSKGIDACRVEFTFGWTPVSLFARVMSPLAFLMKGTLRKCLERDLNCLKRAAEGSGGAAPSVAPA